VWAVLVELYAREAAGAWKAEHTVPPERIPARLWITAPIESARTWLRQGRTGVREHQVARRDVGLHAAAVEALRLALPEGAECARVRRIIGRQLRAGSMPPTAVLAAIGWTGDLSDRTPEAVLRAALADVLTTSPGRSGASAVTASGVGSELDVMAAIPATSRADDGPAEASPDPAPATRGRTRRGTRRKTAGGGVGRLSDAELLARVTAAVEAGEFTAGEVSGNRLRTFLGVGAERARRLADDWTTATEQSHITDRTTVRALHPAPTPAAAGSAAVGEGGSAWS
jgi:hypothetical protein